MNEPDYIVVGGGTAGCIVAARLSEDNRTRVLLLEHGKKDSDLDWTVRMPAAMGINFAGKKHNYHYHTEPETYLDGRKVFQPRGRILGGSSSINGMCFTRGNPNDYERWASEGASGWSYADVLPYFRKLESFDGGDDRYRGRNGPVRITRGPLDYPAYSAFLEAGAQAGYPRTPDINGPQQEGFGLFDRNTDRGVRASTSWAYLKPARGRTNLSIVTQAKVTKIIVENGAAVGVTYTVGNVSHTVRCKREIVLSAGAINTPDVMLRSGIGDAEELRRCGIDVAHALPGVGKNLQDHLEFYLCWSSRPEVSLNPRMTRLGKALIGLQWILARSGPGASNHDEAVAFVRSGPDAAYPDVQMQFMPLQFSDGFVPQPKPAGFSIAVAHQRPTSRGEVTLNRSDIGAAPLIRLNYLSTDFDREMAKRCVRIARSIVAQDAFKHFLREELTPGVSVQSDEEIEAYCKSTSTSGYHVSGTCRIGPANDRLAVVDPHGSVHGLRGLRVVDASVFPSLTTGNTNAAVMMTAEKLSDAILGKPALRDEGVPFQQADRR